MLLSVLVIFYVLIGALIMCGFMLAEIDKDITAAACVFWPVTVMVFVLWGVPTLAKMTVMGLVKIYWRVLNVLQEK